MTTTTNCPACSAALELPEEYSLGDHAECPNCGSRFGLSEVVPRPLHRAILVGPVEREPAEEAPTAVPSSNLPQQPTSLPGITETAGAESAPTLSELISEVDPYGTVASDNELGKEVRDELSKRQDVAAKPPSPASWEPPEFDEPSATEEPTASESTADESTPVLDTAASAFEEIPQLDGEPTSSEFRIPALTETQSTTNADTLQLNFEPERRRRKSPLKLLAGTLAGGAVGVVGGLFALLWILGPEGDYLQVAQYLPETTLPPSFQPTSLSAQEQGNDFGPGATSSDATSFAQAELESTVPPITAEQDATTPVRRDSEVVAASAQSPAAAPQKPSSPQLPERELMKHALAFLEQQDIAEAALPELVNGSLDDPATVPVKGGAYITVCSFAEQCGFVNRDDLDTRMVTRSIVGKDFFRDMLDIPELGGEITRIASRWWTLPEPPNRGIFFPGTVEDVRAVGLGTLMTVKLQTDQGPLVLPTYAKGEGRPIGSRIGVVGVVLEGDDLALNSLAGEYDKVVVAHFTFRVSN
ncbi:MAG: hypothetical protein AAGA92_06400 [Planctomycetota bacterium]